MKIAFALLVGSLAISLVAGEDGTGDRPKCQFASTDEEKAKCCSLGFVQWCKTDMKHDPHFTTWNGSKFDFHGECDLVFVQNPGFRHGLGLDIHARTKIVRNWSYIDVAVVKIGKDVLEFKGGAEDRPYWINQVAQEGTAPNKIGDFPIEYKRISKFNRQLSIDIGDDHRIQISTYKDLVGLAIIGGNKEDFEKSVGLTGEYGTGRKLGRDGREITDPDEFGQEWQVHPEDGLYFRTVQGPQFPLEQCKMPSSFQASQRHRRLGESTAKLQAAEKACADKISDPQDFDNCVFDVLLTDDIGIAATY
jgi:hypothetical protein